MNTWKVERVLKKVAEKEGVTVAEVRREIEMAIAEAWRNPDPTVRATWESVPRRGEVLTPEEAIAFFASIIK